jgi:hypothetical protein
MKRLLLSSVAAAAIGAAGIPAIAGLAGNPSFSHKLPVRAPSQAEVVHFDDRGRTVPSGTPSAHRPTEPGDDRSRTPAATEPHHGRPTTEPGDDRGGDRPRATEPGDDRGGDRPRATEPGDNRGGHGHGRGSGRP